MSLTRYKQKRNLKETPEPAGGKAKDQRLRFVIQKHNASRLHYDLRLEMGGVLKSWAVPKGPSMDPKIKRLAMMVEDHPYDYKNFEGIIPDGNYGAGTVMVWDEGTYEAAEINIKDKKVQEADLINQLQEGKIKFVLHGIKLKGEFTLIKSRTKKDNAWLLMKRNDQNSSTEDVLEQNKSVLSHKTIEQINSPANQGYGLGNPVKKNIQKDKTVNFRRSAPKIPVAVKKKKSPKKIISKINPDLDTLLVGSKKVSFSDTLTPMLATLVDKPFDKEGWVYEIKWDGYRAMAFMDRSTIELKSRNQKSFNEKFYPVHQALKDWNIDAIIDGEMVVLKHNGVSDFGTLQNWRSEADGKLIYYVFDILWFEGKDLCGWTLQQRRDLLKTIVPSQGIIRLSESFDLSGTDFFLMAKENGLEGIMAKKAGSKYVPGARTKDWLKIKANKRHEVVIGGYTHNQDSPKSFSSLLVGAYENGKFIYTGKIGTGFKDEQQKDMLQQFKPLVTDHTPFLTTPDINKPSRFNPKPSKANATWLKPELVCEVSYTEMTVDGVMRHPSFEGMRMDKKAKDVIIEKPIDSEKTMGITNRSERKEINSEENKERKSLLNPSEETQVKVINGHKIKFTNLGKLYWPDDNVTKRDMLNYYYQVAPYILPYLKDRPQSLNRFPNGIYGKSFYQKDVTGKVPDWVQTYLYHSSDNKDIDKHFLVPQEEADVLLMASMGCIELNPWSSQVDTPDNPDWCIIDLDPDGNSFNQVIEAAQVTRNLLDSLGIPSYCKTSGSTGLHIYIPLGAQYTYEQSKEFARAIVARVQKEIPKYTSIERLTANRKGKIYLDFLQNRPKATLAAPYSLRPKKGATVSMPLHWEEVKKGLKMQDFTIFNAIKRIHAEGDLFKPVLGKGIKLDKIDSF